MENNPPHIDLMNETQALKKIASESIPTTREFAWFQSDGEMLLQELDSVLDARQLAWSKSKSSPEQCLREIQEIKSLTLKQTLHEIKMSDLSLAFLFYDQQKLLPRMQRKLLDIYGRSPELARLIVDLSIVGGHGSRSGSLVHVFQHGLRPTEYQKQNQLMQFTGTYDWGGNNFNRTAVSFVSWVNERDLMHYSNPPAVNIQNLDGWMGSYNKEITQPNLEPQRKLILNRAKQMSNFLSRSDKTDIEHDIEICLREDFPLLFLIDNHTISTRKTHNVDSDIQHEFSIDEGLSQKDIPIILVPEANTPLVEKLGKKYGWTGHILDIGAYSTISNKT